MRFGSLQVLDQSMLNLSQFHLYSSQCFFPSLHNFLLTSTVSPECILTNFVSTNWILCFLFFFHNPNCPLSGQFCPCRIIYFKDITSIQFSCSVVSDSLWPHELQHTRPPCPSPTPGVYPNSCPSSRWCHPPISSSVIPISPCPQSLPASESFPMSQLFAWGGQSTGVSALASFLPKNTQDWSPLEWTGWISLPKY